MQFYFHWWDCTPPYFSEIGLWGLECWQLLCINYFLFSVVGATPLQFRPDGATSQQGVQHQQLTTPTATVATPPPTHNSLPDPSYEIQDLSVSAANNLTTTQPNMTAPSSIANYSSSSSTLPVVTPRVRKKTPSLSSRQRSKKSTAPEPMVQIVEPQVQRQRPRDSSAILWNKGCQTDPLFDESRLAGQNSTMSADLPEGLVYIEVVDEASSKKAVFTTKEFEEGQEFGPFTGEFVKEGLGCYNPSTWEVGKMVLGTIDT